MILLTSSKLHLFWAELELQSGPHSTGRCGACGLTVGHPEGLSTGHATHAGVHPRCFPVPLGHSSQQVSMGRSDLKGQAKLKESQYGIEMG